jgi:signal transduction histidine kinase
MDTESLRQELDAALRRIERLEQSLVESQRMATVGQLASRMAHEFNNVLMLIVGRADQALKYGDAVRKDEALKKTVEAGKRAANIVLSITGYANNAHTRGELVSAQNLMDAAAGLIAWDLPKSGILLVRQYEADASVRVAPGHMEQVLLNLILNARAAMRQQGGRLTLIVTPAATGYVALKVKDTGCGIPAEHLDKIWDPFFTTRPRPASNGNGGGNAGGRDGGTGLGLPVARDLVRQAGGEIHVESTPGSGSTFSVLLPVASQNQ